MSHRLPSTYIALLMSFQLLTYHGSTTMTRAQGAHRIAVQRWHGACLLSFLLIRSAIEDLSVGVGWDLLPSGARVTWADCINVLVPAGVPC